MWFELEIFVNNLVCLLTFGAETRKLTGWGGDDILRNLMIFRGPHVSTRVLVIHAEIHDYLTLFVRSIGTRRWGLEGDVHLMPVFSSSDGPPGRVFGVGYSGCSLCVSAVSLCAGLIDINFLESFLIARCLVDVLPRVPRRPRLQKRAMN